MYHQSVIQERLEMMTQELGWQPEYHSPEEVDRFTEHLKQWEDKDEAGNVIFTRDLTDGEARFIENEKAISACDAAYWMTRYCYLSDETNTRVKFKFRDTQKIYMAVLADLESEQRAIELLIAKGRQQFVTTVTEILVGHRICNYRDVTSFTASADRDKSAEMMAKVLFLYDNLPWWLRPQYTRRVEGIPGLLEFGDLNSRMRVVHGASAAKKKGGQKTGIARGTTPTVYHLSEVSAFPDPEQQIEAAIFRSVHASPKVLGVLESTFAGDTGWFPKKYKFAKDQTRDGGVTRHYPLFFSWPCNRDLYPTPTWIRTNPVPYKWKPQGKVAEQILKAELFLRTQPLLSKYFGKNWRMPIEQQWFYHTQYIEHERSGSLPTLFQEMPCDDIEALQSSYDNVFGRETINISHQERDRDFEIYAIVGTAIDSKFEPDVSEIDYTKPRISIRHRPPRDDARYEWELVPLRGDVFAELDDPELDEDRRNDKIKELLPYADGRLLVYPNAFKSNTLETSLGVDTSNGISRDSTVLAGTAKGNGLVPDEQLCEFRSSMVNHVEAFAFAFPIALYMKMMNRNNENEFLRWPWIGIEQIAAVGDTCQVQLRRMGYPSGRFFRFGRYDSVELNRKSSRKLGWYTVKWSRDLLIGYMVHAVKNGWYKPNSPWTIDECRTFEIHETSTGKEKMEHSSEAHDDGLFASAISTFINHDLDTLAERGNQKLVGPREDDPPEVVIAPYQGYMLNPGDITSRKPVDGLILDPSILERYRY